MGKNIKINNEVYGTSVASEISYTEEDGSKTTVQDKISELDSNKANSSHIHDYLPLSGGTLTGNLTAKRIDSTNQYLTGSLYVGGKSSTSDGKTGVAFGKSGNVTMQSSSAPTLNFISGTATSPQVKLTADANGSLSMKGNLVIDNEQNNGGLFIKNTSGTLLNVIGIGSTNNLGIGGGLFNAKSGWANIYGGTNVSFHVPKSDGSPLSLTYGQYNDVPFFYPSPTDITLLGNSNKKWGTIYSKTGIINTSDEREKENIIPMGASSIMTLALDDESEPIDIYSELFDRLIPVEFNFIDSTDGRTHFGLVAQQVISAMAEVGFEENDLDLAHHEYYTDEETGEEKDTYGLNYNNLIALLIHEVQKLKAEVASLKAE